VANFISAAHNSAKRGTLAFMKRRTALRSILSLPAITALPAVGQNAAPPEKTPQAQQKLPPEMKPPAVEEIPKLAMTNAEAALAPAPGFFSSEQFAALQRLCDLLVPAVQTKPSAAAAGVPEFLDFLIARSPQPRQKLYRSGLDELNADSTRRMGKPFSEITDAQAAELLRPLNAPWSFEGPSNELGQFLVSAKSDVLRATVNSREWAAASTGRRGSGMGAYWYALD